MRRRYAFMKMLINLIKAKKKFTTQANVLKNSQKKKKNRVMWMKEETKEDKKVSFYVEDKLKFQSF